MVLDVVMSKKKRKEIKQQTAKYTQNEARNQEEKREEKNLLKREKKTFRGPKVFFEKKITLLSSLFQGGKDLWGKTPLTHKKKLHLLSSSL